MRLSYGNNESAQVQDAVSLVAKALNRLLTANRSLTPPTSSCKETSQWDSGQILFQWVAFLHSTTNLKSLLYFSLENIL